MDGSTWPYSNVKRWREKLRRSTKLRQRDFEVVLHRSIETTARPVASRIWEHDSLLEVIF
jgi:hypothetical protein